MKKRALFCFIVFVLDRATKYYVRGLIGAPAAPWLLAPFLYIYPVTNTGIAWGMLQRMPQGVVIGWTLGVTSVLGFHTLMNIIRKKPYTCEIFMLIGALSNIMDRFLWGGVLDFIILSVGSWTFPAFNFADALITGSVFIRLLSHVFWYEST